MNPWMMPTAALLAAGVLAGVGGCGNTMTNSASQVVLDGPPEGLVIGAQTTVGVRPDVLGAARDLPVPIGTDSINGAGVSITGTLHSVGADWIVLDGSASDTRHWLSLDTVTWIKQPKPKPAQTSPANSSGQHPPADAGHDGHG